MYNCLPFLQKWDLYLTVILETQTELKTLSLIYITFTFIPSVVSYDLEEEEGARGHGFTMWGQSIQDLSIKRNSWGRGF